MPYGTVGTLSFSRYKIKQERPKSPLFVILHLSGYAMKPLTRPTRTISLIVKSIESDPIDLLALSVHFCKYTNQQSNLCEAQAYHPFDHIQL